MTEFGIQVSVKTPGDTLINIRGTGPEEFDLNLAYVVEKLDEIKAAETAIKERPLSAQGLIERDLGGVVVGEIVESWPPPSSGQWPAPQQPYQPGPPAQGGYQSNLCGRCGKAPTCATCNAPLQALAKSVKNGQYYVHEGNCPRDHKTYWCNEPK